VPCARAEARERVRAGAPTPVCVPLIHCDELLGVLGQGGSADRVHTDYDLQSVSLFADHAAITIANARLNATERELKARLSEALAR
jgi:GAF domain-containing protein